MSKKLFILTVVIIAIFILGSLSYWFKKDNSKIMLDNAVILSQPIIKWQEITVAESKPKMAMHINAPRIIIGNNYSLYSEINKAVMQHIESIKDDFISTATTAAYDNSETNTLKIDTEVLLMTPRLISLAFISTERFAGINNSEPERTFITFNLLNNKVMIEGGELFPDALSWSRAVTVMKKSLLADYQGEPVCDLLFAPKQNGFATSCIGVDRSRGHERLSLTGDIPISVIQKFITPSALSDITKP